MSRKKQLLILASLIVGTLILTAVLTIVIFAASLSSKESIMNRNKTGLILLDRNNKELYRFYNAHSDTYVPLGDIAQVAREAVIAAEDSGFYEHPGFSIGGIANAIYENIRPGGNDRGGSTLTQQLAKNALLSEDRNVLRKYQELILSLEIERRYTKEEILEMYLNSAYFGEGAFGIEDAARAYFNKAAKELSIAEASMLAGLLPAPSAYSPISGNREYATQRQNYVLGRMQEEGYITETESTAALAQQLTYNPQNPDSGLKAPHFALMVKEELEERYGEETIARSGYRVTTTLNLDWQQKAEGALGSQLDRLAASRASNGSVVAVDPKTGEVLVLVGSRDWNNQEFGKVNMAIAPRQPGSSFKPLVYAAGIENRIFTAATILPDRPKDFGGYRPQNYDGGYRGDVSIRRALANSLNIPAVEALQRIGISEVITTAQELGITTLTEGPQGYGPSLALGTGAVRLTELTNAYATLADNGTRHDMRTVLSIEDKNSRIIHRSTPSERSAISSATAYIISSILSDNNARAEVFGSSLTLADRRPAAVKTGTTDDYRDALTVGYTPGLAVGVWIGNNDNTPMSAVAGSVGSAPIWRQLMQELLAGQPHQEFVRPVGVVAQQVCFGTGAIAETPGSNTYTEYFRAGNVPVERCNAAQQAPEQPEQPPQQQRPEEDEEKVLPPEDPEEEQPPPTEDGDEGEDNPPPEDPENPLPPIPPINP